MHLFDFSLVCVNKCLLKSPASDYAKSHRLHLFDFSPMCVSNVYWTSFDQHRQSHTGCIHLTFLQCEFSNVSSNGRPAAWGDTKSHWLHLFGFSPLCVSKCLLKELGSAQAKSHRMHFFVCVIRWSSKCLYVNHTRLLDSFCFSYKVRATISRMVCSSISSIL